MAMATKNAVLWDIMPRGCCKNIIFIRSVLRWLVTANFVPSSPILVTLMIEELRSSETSVITRATLRSIPRDGIRRNIDSLWSHAPIF
jgi:hypothetical protein